MTSPGPEGQIQVEAIYGAQTRRGLVQVRLGTLTALFSLVKAREVAAFLLEAAGAAEGDEAMMAVLERMELSAAKQRQFLLALRSARGRIDRNTREEARRAVAEDQGDLDRTD